MARTKKDPAATPTDTPLDRDTAMFNEWKRGAPIHQLVNDFGPISRSKVRSILTTASGGKDKFQTLREAGAGGAPSKSDAPKGERAPRPARNPGDAPPPPRIDDSNVPMVLSCKTIDGWTQRFRGKSTDLIFTSPEGVSYVRALDTQAADLIHIGVPEGLPVIRLRRYSNSGLEQRATAKAADDAALKVQQSEQRATKKAKRDKRKTRLEKRATKTGR